MRAAFLDPSFEAGYRNDGYHVAPFLNRDEVATLSGLYDEAASGVNTGFYSSLWSEDVEYRGHVHREIGRIIERPMRGVLQSYRMALANFVVKHAQQKDSKVPVHQDWSMIDEAKHLPIALWCPLVNVTPENGCLAVVPGSHALVSCIRPNQPHGAGFTPFRDLSQRIESELLREIPMAAGDAIFYHPGLLHGSRVNTAPTTRVAVVAVFVPSEARLHHYFQDAAATIDVYDVPEDFYWKDAKVASPPKRELLAGSIPSGNQPLSESAFDALLKQLSLDGG